MSKTCNCYLVSGEHCRYNAKPHSLYCGVHKSCKKALPKRASPKKSLKKRASPKRASPKRASPKRVSPKPNICPPGKEPHPKDPKKCLVSCKPGLVRSMDTMRCKKVENDPKDDSKDEIKDDSKDDDKIGESIVLMITGHGSDLKELSKDEKDRFKNVKIAYRIPHNILNFIYPSYFNVLRNRYIDDKKFHSNQDIMDEYIRDCEKNKVNDDKILKNYEKYVYPGHASPLASMIKKKKQCYVGRAVVDRLFWFGDKTWKKTQNLPTFTKITNPFMGNMFVLRATKANGEMLQGELLAPLKKSDGLDPLRRSVKNMILTGSMYIRLSQLLPLLQKSYKRVYIYDFACRQAMHTLQLDSKNRQRIYQEEKRLFTPQSSPRK
jgi:hypothetical protein